MPSLYSTLFLTSLLFSFALSAERRQLPADFSSLPSCGQSCLIGAATSGDAGCPITDFQCFANNSAFKNSVTKCVISTCSQADMLKVAKWATKASAALGIPLHLPSAGSVPSSSPEKATTPGKQKPDASEDKPASTKEQHSSVAKTDHNLTPAKNESLTYDSQDKSTSHHKSSKKTDSDTEEGQTSSKETQASGKATQSSPKSDHVPTNTSAGATPHAGMSLAALDFASLPKCGQTCLISAVTTSGGSCAMTDFACLSGSTEFKIAVAKSFTSSCSPADAAASIQWSLKAAASLGLSVRVPSSAGHSTNATMGASTNTSASINNTPVTPISSNSMMNTSTPIVDTPTASLSSPSSSAEDGASSGGSKLMTTTHVFSMTLMIVLISYIL